MATRDEGVDERYRVHNIAGDIVVNLVGQKEGYTRGEFSVPNDHFELYQEIFR